MKASEVTLPVLPNEKNNPARPISSAKLNSPVSGSAFAPKDGDVFVFDIYDEEGKVYAVEQDITNSTYTSVNVACHRNGKPSWLALGQLTRLDADMKPTCDFCAEMRTKSLVDDIFDTIKGKTLTVVSMVEKEFVPFGQTARVKRMTPEFKLS
jgi:hypothetical protein